MARSGNKKNDEQVVEQGGFKFRYALYIAATLLIILALISHNPVDNSILDGGAKV